MPRSRSQKRRAAEEREESAPAPEADEAVSIPASPPAETPARVRLKLKKREFVRGKLCEAGTVHEFAPDEAQRRLTTTDKWIPA